MFQTEQFHGIIPPISIVLDENGQLDHRGMGQLIDFLIDSGVNGLFFLGSGGEFSQMTTAERKELAAFATEHVAGRVPVLIGTGSPNTREAIELTKHSKEIGADAAVIINPYYWVLTEENLFNHYAQIAEAVEFPLFLYNFPGTTGQDLHPEFVLKLVKEYEHIIGIKETVASGSHIREMLQTVRPVRPNFKVFCGFDDQLLNTLALGGDGAISGSVNFAPELQIELYKAFQEKEFEKVMDLHKRLAIIASVYKLDSPFVNVVKEAIRMREILDISSYSHLPATYLKEEKKKKLQQILNDACLKKMTYNK